MSKTDSKAMARRMVCGYLNGLSSLGFEEKIIECANVNGDDEVLLEHIDIMIPILQKAKEQIEKEKNENDK